MSSLGYPFVCASKVKNRVSCVGKAKSGWDDLLATAAILGHKKCLKILITENKDQLVSGDTNAPNHSYVVPLRAACSYGRLNIVKLLLEHGADVDAKDEKGVTSLMIAAYNGYLNVLKYLISKGAEVNGKTINGTHALHVAAESGYLDVMKVLLKHNARMEPDPSGKTPIVTASSIGHVDIVEYLVRKQDLISTKDKIDALELLGATFICEMQNITTGLDYWRYAMNMRYVKGILIHSKTENHLTFPSQEDLKEVITLQQLEEIESDHDAVILQALLVKERVLGPADLSTMNWFRFTGLAYAYRGDFRRCINLWMHALEMQQNHLKPLNEARLFHLLSFIGLFIDMTNIASANFGISMVVIYFEDILSLLEKCTRETELIFSLLNKADKCDSFGTAKHTSLLESIITIIMPFLLLLTRLKPSLSPSQWHTVKRAVYKLVKIDPRNVDGMPLLHLACFMSVSDKGNPMIKPMSLCLEVVSLLLEVGADPNATDHHGNTPLHILACTVESSMEIMDALLLAGAHLDASNRLGHTLMSIRASRGMQPCQVDVFRHTSLQCLAAACIRKQGIPYKTILNPKLEQFVDIH